MKKLSFVIPCYNSERTIAHVVAEIDSCFLNNDRYEYEIVLVNDASPRDDTLGEIQRLARENPRVTAVNLSKNFGQDSALMAGYSVAQGDYIVSLDDDGQNPAAEAWKLLDKLEEGWDVVFGKYEHKMHSKFKNFGSRVNDWMAQILLDKPKGLRLCSYFAMDRFVVDEMQKDRNSFPYIWGLILRTTNRITNVYIDHRPREEGKSNFTLIKCLKVWMNGFIAFSVKPLRFSAVMGTLIACLGFLYGLYIVLKQMIFGEPVEGWSSLMTAVLLLGGIILMMLGLLGEYIGRMNINLNNSPQYIIRDVYQGKRLKENSTMPEVTVVIPNYNGMVFLKDCLASLKEQTMTDFRILVVDNGSSDGSLMWITEEYPAVDVLGLDKNYGFCVAVNRGIQAADTPYVILLNNDTRVEPAFVEVLLGEIKRSEQIFSCQAKMLDFRNRGVMDDAGDFYCALGWAFARGKGKPENLYNVRVKIFAACAGAAIYRKSVFEKIGYFDELHFAYLEDIDLGYRAKIYGYENYFVPGARVYHMGSATTGSVHNEFKVRLSARNSIYLAYKNMPLPQLIINSPLLAVGIVMKFLFFSGKHLGKEYRQGIAQGLSLCKRENKVKYDRKHLANYWKIQLELWGNIYRRLRKF